eukprot:356295-Chlamydomonas_euryale.AAC.14
MAQRDGQRGTRRHHHLEPPPWSASAAPSPPAPRQGGRLSSQGAPLCRGAFTSESFRLACGSVAGGTLP